MRALLLILLLAPVAQAAPGLTAASVETEGASLEADLAVLHSLQPGGEAVPAFGSFHLTAPSLRAEIDTRSTDLAVLSFGITESHNDRIPRSLQNATVASATSQADTYLFVTPLAGSSLQVQAPSLGIEAGQGSVAEYAWVPMTRPRPEVDLGSTQSLTSAAPHQIIIDGSFRLSVWGWGLDVEHSEGREAWSTGQERQDIADAPGLQGAQRVYENQTYFFVPEGRLVLDVEDPGALQVYTTATAATADQATLHDARGLLAWGDHTRILEGAEVTLHEAELRFKDSTGSRVGVVVGDADSAIIDGHRIKYASEANTSLAWLAAFVVAAVALGFLARRQMDPARAIRRAEAAMVAADTVQAFKWAKRAARSRFLRHRALVLQAAALGRAGRIKDAASVLEGVPSDGQDASAAFVRAFVLWRNGDEAGARANLNASLRLDPSLRALLPPAMERLLNPVAMDGLI